MASKKRSNQSSNSNGQDSLPLAPAKDEHLDISALETWLWDAACVIRGAADAPKYKDFILPLIFFKRLSDVFDDEFEKQVEIFGDETLAHQVIEADHKDALEKGRKPTVRFYIPSDYTWEKIRNHSADGSLGEFVTGAMREVAKLNPELEGVLDVKDFNERQSGQRLLDDDLLHELIEVVNRHRLGLRNTEPDILGRAYEYLLRKFAEGQGQSAGEFYTPKEVGWLMAELINPKPYTTIYDPTCGSGGLLIKARLFFEKSNPDQKSRAPKLYGQELNPVTFAIAKMNMFLHDYTDSLFAIGDTFKDPKFTESSRLKEFDYVVANPMWNQSNYNEEFYENDKWNRFLADNSPPTSSADWGWCQHILASLKEKGHAAVVLDTGAASRGSGSRTNNKEKEIRKMIIEKDFVESVILLPDNLFYNTNAPGIILFFNRNKSSERKEQILIINASNYFRKEKPKNVLTNEGIRVITEVYNSWETREKLSKVVSLEEIRNADYNLSPSQFVEITDKTTHRPISEILADLAIAKDERGKADEELTKALSLLNFDKENR